MEAQSTVVLAGAAIAVFLIALAMVRLWVRRRARRRGPHDPLPLIPVGGGRVGVPAPPRRRPSFRQTPPSGRDVAARDAPTAAAMNGRGDNLERFAPPRGDPPSRSPAVAHVGASAARASEDAYAEWRDDTLAEPAPDFAGGTAVDGASVRYWRPPEGTLQFLPGRLEILSGRDAGQEIRFVRTPGPDGTCVTFGRAEGPPYRHIQLREATVSRSHARMTLESRTVPSSDGRGRVMAAQWHLENLSATNPVVVNGRPLAADGGEGATVELQDGDRIEMGEVIFRFHAR